MKLKNRKSYINKSTDGIAPKRLMVTFSHWLYMSILVFIFSYFVYFIYLSSITYKGVGIVRIDKTLLSPLHNGKIINLKLKEGDKVEKDSLLAILKPSRVCKIKEIKEIAKTQKIEKIEEIKELKEDKRIVQLEHDILMKQNKIVFLKNKRSQIKDTDNQLILKRALEITDKQVKNRQLKQSLTDDLNLLINEISIKSKLLNKLKYQFKQRQHINNQLKKSAEHLRWQANQLLEESPVPEIISPIDPCPNDLIHAPFKGVIKRLFLKLSEFAKQGEPFILIQPEAADVYIEAFVSKDELKYLKLKQTVSIIFPDDVMGVGVVEDIFSSAYQFPELERNNYEPIDVRIRVNIKPLDNSQSILWRKYDLLRVKIKGEYE